MRSQVFEHMLNTRERKYRSFLRYLRFYKYASFSWNRGKFLESYYTLMRYLDDVVDGDAPLPEGYINGTEYLTEKIRFSEDPRHPDDEVDFLMLHCFDLAKSFGEDFGQETKDILNSLHFDAQRRGTMDVFSEQDLMRHFHLLDVRGTIRATLKIFKEDPEKYPILEPLGIATRYQYDLEDFEVDINAGYVNISEEECQQFGISSGDLPDIGSPGIRKWFRHRAEKGLDLLAEHHRRLPEGKFSFIARATFPLVYELPARKLFHKILSEM